jgi:hypothetical protein
MAARSAGTEWATDGGPVVSTPGAIHRDSGCVSAGIQHNSPGQHRLGVANGVPGWAQSVTLVTALQTLKLQRSDSADPEASSGPALRALRPRRVRRCVPCTGAQ